MERDATLRISNLHAGYGDSEVIHGIDLTVPPASITTIIGPNGAGKSTLLRAIFGLAKVSQGSIRMSDVDVRSLSKPQLLRAGIAFVPQGRCNFPGMTVAENLEMGAFTLPKSVAGGAVRRVYEEYPLLAEKRHANAGTLSGGQQQLLEMAMALVVSPQVLLIDEPSLGLAPMTLNGVLDDIKAISVRGVTVLMVEQNARQALQRSDRGVVLELGRKALEGSGPDLLRDRRLGELYLGGTSQEVHERSE